MNLWLAQPAALFLASHTADTCILPTAKTDRGLKLKKEPKKPVALARSSGTSGLEHELIYATKK